jgi:HSP20 family protein
MSSLKRLGDGLSDAWDSLVHGWQSLYQRATNAITRFNPRSAKGELLPRDAQETVLRSSGWGVLAAEVFDDEDRVVVRLEAPGMDKDAFTLQVIDDRLVVRGEKRVQHEESKGRYHISECAYGSFQRAIALPDQVDAHRAKAKYKRGVLRVELPKTEARRRRIQVEVD